jgi:hypothetical protein
MTLAAVFDRAYRRAAGGFTMRTRLIALASALAVTCGLSTNSVVPAISAAVERVHDDEVPITHSVSGSGVHFFTTMMIHSQQPTPTGMIQRSTDIVELSGDLKGRVLYHPTSVFDFVNGTLVNTGHQVFSGTVLESAPVMLHDDEFRFEVNLNTGTESGEVHLSDRIAGPKVRCDLVIAGTGTKTPEGNPIVDYKGTCTFKK